MTHEQLEEFKRRQLERLIHSPKEKSVFKASATEKGIEYEFEGSLIGIVATAFSGLDELGKKIPEAAEIIDAAFEGYKMLRDMDRKEK